MVSYLYRMPAGIPGDVNRVQNAVIVAQVITPAGNANAPTGYGLGGVIDATSGQFRLAFTGDTSIFGILARPYPTNSTQNGLGVATPPASGACDVLRRGFMSVTLYGATPAINGGAVYVYLAASNGNHVQGGFEAAAGANLLLVPGAVFTGPADASGNTEISYLP